MLHYRRAGHRRLFQGASEVGNLSDERHLDVLGTVSGPTGLFRGQSELR